MWKCFVAVLNGTLIRICRNTLSITFICICSVSVLIFDDFIIFGSFSVQL